MADEKTYQRVRNICEEFSLQYCCFNEARVHKEKFSSNVAILVWNNFYDVAVLNWAHLFGNWEDSLHFRNVLTEPDRFKEEILSSLCISEADWKRHHGNLYDFRCKRVAHIDPIDKIYVPELDLAYKCICLYYEAAAAELESMGSMKPIYLTIDSFLDRKREYIKYVIEKIALTFA